MTSAAKVWTQRLDNSVTCFGKRQDPPIVFFSPQHQDDMLSVGTSWIGQSKPWSAVSNDDSIVWTAAPTSYKPARETLGWCCNFVLRLGLCPWAPASIQQLEEFSTKSSSQSKCSATPNRSLRESQCHHPNSIPTMQFFMVSNSRDMKRAVQSVARYFWNLVIIDKAMDPSAAIFFVLCEDASWDFHTFYSWFCDLEEMDWDDEMETTTMDSSNDNTVQNQVTLAPFHPDWTFEEEEDIDNETSLCLQFEKKSPYPTVTLVWTDIIEAAGPTVTKKIASYNEIALCSQSVQELTQLYQLAVYNEEDGRTLKDE